MTVDETNDTEPLLLSAREAAELLNVSEKTLWSHTRPRGNQIPAIRFGKTVRYSRDALKTWIAHQSNGTTRDASG
jgi:excisionase family DNA binding protein